VEFISAALDFLLHVDKYLLWLTQNYGAWIYLILFAIIFCETGCVATPFLPGDSLLFIAGALAASGMLNVYLLALVLMLASFSGDNVNYWLGRLFGPKLFSRTNSRFFRPEYLQSTNKFYAKHGGKAVIIGRFLPVARTFMPFVAGIGRMKYARFVGFSACGSVLWIGIFLVLGYFFGRTQYAQDHLMFMIVLVIAISLLPWLWVMMKKNKA